MLFDEILDEEEELARKINKLKRRKIKKENGQESEEDDFVDEEDESFYDDDFVHQTLSGEEDTDELHSYRNNHNENNIAKTEFLNESTADFNKEIRQINMELREQLETEGAGLNDEL